MAINSINGKSNNSVQPALTKTDKQEKPQASSIEASGDTLDIAQITQDIKKALESSATTPVIDNQKVDAVKQALQNGSYQIDADRIAQKLMQFDHPFEST